jgi:NAD(P)H-flavin reductase
MKNPYVPEIAKIIDVRDEALGVRPIKTFKVSFQNGHDFNHRPGQCAIIGLLGTGESMISIASSPTKNGYLEFSVMKLGKVTSALHACETVQYILDNREDYGKLDIIYGARTTNDLCFKEELFELEKRDDVNVHLSIDMKEEGWTRFVGFVPTNLLEVKPPPDNTIAITCGPVVMIKFVIKNLLALGFSDQQIFTTMENRMKCGIGKCGRCNVGHLYVCKDGPVFSYATLKDLPEF